MLYLISYDLVTPGKNYQALRQELANFGAVRVLDSEWVVRRQKTTPLGLANHFVKFIDANDRLLVTELPSNYAYRGLLAEPEAA